MKTSNKSTKTVVLVVLGYCLLSVGVAFAGENAALGQAGNPALWATAIPAAAPVQAAGPSAAPAAAATAVVTAAPAAAPAIVPPVPAATAAVPEKKPTMGEKIKKIISDNKQTLFLGGLASYLGFALLGTLAGALTGGLLFVGVIMLMGM